LSEQAAAIVEENAMIAVAQVYPPKGSNNSDVESLGSEEEEEEEESEADERAKKRLKHDPLAEFRNADGDGPRKKSSNFKAEVHEELRHYESITGVNLTQAHAIRSIFDPLLWWGEQRYNFPVSSYLARQLLVIPAASAELERHFSGAGKIARKDRRMMLLSHWLCTMRLSGKELYSVSV